MASTQPGQNPVSRTGSLRIVTREDGDGPLHVALNQSKSLGRVALNSGLWRRGSLSLSRRVDVQLPEDIESEIFAQAGDSGRLSSTSSLRLSVDDLRRIEAGELAVADDEYMLPQTNGSSFGGEAVTDDVKSPSPAEFAYPLAADGLMIPKDTHSPSHEQNAKQKGTPRILPQQVEHLSCLIHLAVFGILGVFSRYLLQKLFGPGIIHWTDDGTTLYPDLPSNMVGSFLMGWMGIVFKGDIRHISDPLVIGLTTGFLGSLTTFSGWNQKMLDLASEGKWVLAVIGYITGMVLAVASICIGVETAEGFRSFIKRFSIFKRSNLKVDKWKLQSIMLIMLILLWGLFWGVSVVLLKTHLKARENTAQLWLACLVGPLGVWIRWYLARLNGRGLGRRGTLKWVPFGTLAANVLAACLMAALATVRKAVSTYLTSVIVNGIQLGFLGCLSTVSTFVAEVYALNHSKQHSWRAWAYSLATIIFSFALGILLYCVPVWAKDYH